MAFSPHDREMMKLALKEAAATSCPSPNPRVGAVVTDSSGHILSTGAHWGSGTPHAEAAALDLIGPAAQGGVLYCTLEPCFGTWPGKKQSPCSEKVVASGISRLVVATADPHPRVSGQGLRFIEQAGIHVETGLLATEALELNEGWFFHSRHNRPLVTIKSAITLDGYIADPTGTSQWITGPEARRRGHELRASVDAVLVGSGTYLADSPRLNVRDVEGEDPQIVVLDGQLRTQPVPGTGLRTIVYTQNAHPPQQHNNRQAWLDAGAEVVELPYKSSSAGIPLVLQDLGKRGIRSLLVEGGAQVVSSFLDSECWEYLELMMAPKLLGGGKHWCINRPEARLQNAMDLADMKVEHRGEDLVLRSRRKTYWPWDGKEGLQCSLAL